MIIYECTDCYKKRMGPPAVEKRYPTTKTQLFVWKVCPGCHQISRENAELWKLEQENQVHANWIDGTPDRGVHINDLRRAVGLPTVRQLFPRP